MSNEAKTKEKVVSIEELRGGPGKALSADAMPANMVFSEEAWHMMNARDDQLVRDMIVHGSTQRAFVYEFNIAGTRVQGVSVVGARHMASKYKGIKVEKVMSITKRGDRIEMMRLDPPGLDMMSNPALADDDDYYEVVMRVTDIKTGNSLDITKREYRFEKRRDGSTYERPHYATIAESKAVRNGILNIMPQDVVREFMNLCLQAGDVSREYTLEQMQDGVLQYAARAGLTIDRRGLQNLTASQIRGLREAVREGNEAGFLNSAATLGIIIGERIDAPPPPGEELEATPPPPAAEKQPEIPGVAMPERPARLNKDAATIADTMEAAGNPDDLDAAYDLKNLHAATPDKKPFSDAVSSYLDNLYTALKLRFEA